MDCVYKTIFFFWWGAKIQITPFKFEWIAIILSSLKFSFCYLVLNFNISAKLVIPSITI